VTVALPVATVTVVSATTNRVLCSTLAAEEARVLVVGATVRSEEDYGASIVIYGASG
jgi:hypothetical protein